MWKYDFSEFTSASPERLWSPLVDVQNWPQIDRQIESIEIEGSPGEGKVFFLTPRSGPRLKLQIETLVPPKQYTDLCFLPLARMRTTHSLSRVQNQTEIRVSIEIKGPLTFLWKRIVGMKHASGLKQQTRRLIECAQSVV
ncbi:MAG: hypothetical protein AAFU85_24960 [Planctomycetota bacterium]